MKKVINRINIDRKVHDVLNQQVTENVYTWIDL